MPDRSPQGVVDSEGHTVAEVRDRLRVRQQWVEENPDDTSADGQAETGVFAKESLLPGGRSKGKAAIRKAPSAKALGKKKHDREQSERVGASLQKAYDLKERNQSEAKAKLATLRNWKSYQNPDGENEGMQDEEMDAEIQRLKERIQTEGSVSVAQGPSSCRAVGQNLGVAADEDSLGLSDHDSEISLRHGNPQAIDAAVSIPGVTQASNGELLECDAC